MADLSAVEAWLDGAPNRERSGDFAAMRLAGLRRVLAHLPPPPAPCTVGGTKGKGSTVRFIEAALGALGLHTVAFTSPHVASVAERWRLDGVPAAGGILAAAMEVVAAAERRAGMPLTYFERTAAMAVVLAADRPGCLLLWEVGLGGRLDCANALDCAVAVITHLSHDHRDILGPTLTHIAAEKLPIARPGRPLLIAPQTAEAAAAIGANLPPGVPVQWIAPLAGDVPLGMLGVHQRDNAATALAAAKILAGGRWDEAAARRGLATAALAARCQLVARDGRRLLIDGAHNGPSIAATVAVAARVLRPGWTLILGLAKDKEIDEIAAVLPAGVPVVRCGYAGLRARGRDDWPPVFAAVPWFPCIGEALARVPAGDLCITGSFYLAGEALTHVGERSLPG